MIDCAIINVKRNASFGDAKLPTRGIKILENSMRTSLPFPLAVVSIACVVITGVSVMAEPPRFKVHEIEGNSPLVRDSVMMVTLSDLDRDGDLDWTVGTCWPKPLEKRSMYWYEYRGPSDWARHKMGQDADQYGGACSVDLNADGYPDIVTANIWINDLRNGRWQFVRSGLPSGAHDIVAADMNGDEKVDILAFTQKKGLNWYSFSEDLSKPWTAHAIAPFDYVGAKVHATGSPSGVADLDNDGDADVAAIGGWFENADGKGKKWNYKKHGLFPSVNDEAFPWGFAVKTAVCDIDGDGDNDIVQSECDTRMPAGIVWLENTNSRGDFKLHWIKRRVAEDFHTLSMLDYDNDGDLDVLSGVGPLAAADCERRAYLFENPAVGGNATRDWKAHTLHSGMPVHEGTSGDVDGDGDSDVIIKPWNKKDSPKDFLYLENRLISRD